MGGFFNQRREWIVVETLPVFWHANQGATNRHNNLGCIRV